MNCSNFLTQIHYQIVDAFASQNPELFDVVFEIEGKKLYAEKIRLSVASPTFKAMLSDQWHSNKDEPIKITEYKFEDFKEFISFIYSGICNFNQENIFSMIDMAEFFQIPYLKQLCDEHLSKMKYNFGNVFKVIEISNKYSLVQTKIKLAGYIDKYFYNLVESDEFLNLCKSDFQLFIALLSQQEDIFQAVYEWSEFQGTKEQEKSVEEYLDLNELILAEIKEYLPLFDLAKMKRCFVASYVVDRAFIFSDEESTKFFSTFNLEVKEYKKCFAGAIIVKITNAFGQSISGTLCYETHEEEIRTLKSLTSWKSDNFNDSYIFWWFYFAKHSTPSSLKKRVGIEWYLACFYNGDIGVKHFNDIDDRRDYLLAEMVVENEEMGFDVTADCEIEIIE